MNALIDPNGQPLNMRFNADRRLERDISEMLGLAKGILSDGRIADEEVNLIRSWIRSHPDARNSWPGNVLAQRLERIFDDGLVSEEEREDLHSLLNELVGGKAGIIGMENAATTLPLDKPAPQISFSRKVFVLTGKFAFGPRAACQRFTRDAGGVCEDGITKRTNYLVIGTFGSRDWVHTSHGRKIEKVLEYRKSSAKISIVGEDHWASSLPAPATPPKRSRPQRA
jgi:hypothetical protein